MTIKLIDFKSAAIFNTKKKKSFITPLMKDVVGSAYYIAPEILNSDYDEKCDIWSIGVIFYMLIVGKPPIQGYNELEIIK